MSSNSTKPNLLVVDDENSILESLGRLLKKEKYNVFLKSSAEAALPILEREKIALLLTDLRLPKMSGLELMKLSRQLSPETEIILMTAYGSVELAVESIKEGAYDFITKPIKRAALLKTLEKALEKQLLVSENRELRRKLSAVKDEKLLIGNSSTFRQTQELIAQVAPSNANVLLLGESGTGKELAAHSIHRLSQRALKPFITVNCAALPESIIESELFGYVKGAFTGAETPRQGRFMQANGGTLFLDEIGELAPHIQVKLLRILQEGKFEAVGSDKTVKTDFRLIAATHKNLKKEVTEGRFREDLYYRLNVISITIPPLRERLDDIPLLSAHFLQKYNKKNSKNIKGISSETLDILTSYHWPGNVRELENVIERGVVLCRDEILDIMDLPPELTTLPPQSKSISVTIGLPLGEIEKQIIKETLKFTQGNKKEAARILGIAVRTIYRRVSDNKELLE
jgi:DNA-binding NtrC family response regulator